MYFYLIVMILVFSWIFVIQHVLISRPNWAVNLFVEIWGKPYPKKHTITKWCVVAAVVSYFVILILSIIDKY